MKRKLLIALLAATVLSPGLDYLCMWVMSRSPCWDNCPTISWETFWLEFPVMALCIFGMVLFWLVQWNRASERAG